MIYNMEMISLWDYTGKGDVANRGKKVNEYAIYKNQPFEKRKLDFNGTEVFLYTREFLDEYFKIEQIFNK
tara:strand:- start:34 stop:243 length:210 start_codon:yes stop_codon:yes gene_type:complete